MKTPARIAMLVILFSLTGVGWAFHTNEKESAPEGISAAAANFLGTLSERQHAQANLTADSKQRIGWHFIPKRHRKGVQIRSMNEKQKKSAYALLKNVMSEAGYKKARVIMQLESILYELEKPNINFKRDPLRYFFTIFGKPDNKSRWGLSIEGHHLSLNFVIEKDKIVASTPAFFGANPATVKGDHGTGLKKGTRVLAREETLAFDLIGSLSDEQRKVAMIAEKAPADIRAAGTAQPPTDKSVGISVEQLTREQRGTLRKLVQEYLVAMPADVAKSRRDAILAADPLTIRFAWAGATKPGVGHYYRIQGPTFLIEFCNIQPDPAGNIANHIHLVWRELAGDFGVPIKK